MDEDERHRLVAPALDEDAAELSLRPRRLAEYIGQDKVKENLRILIDAATRRGEGLDHILLYGPPGMRQNSERTWAYARVGTWCCPPDLAYAASNTAHTSPHRSAKSRRWSARETVSFRWWR